VLPTLSSSPATVAADPVSHMLGQGSKGVQGEEEGTDMVRVRGPKLEVNLAQHVGDGCDGHPLGPSRVVSCQPPAHDQDITSSDMTILVTFDSKVKRFFVMSICNTFDKLILNHNICLISFSEVLTWIKENIEYL
jgi:hypothetical protein